VVTDAVLDWWFGLCNWLLDFLPDDPNPASTIDLSWLTNMNYFLPLSEMFQVFIAMFSLGGVFAGSSLIIWVLVGIIRGGNAKA
jgi:hypothetical protein